MRKRDAASARNEPCSNSGAAKTGLPSHTSKQPEIRIEEAKVYEDGTITEPEEGSKASSSGIFVVSTTALKWTGQTLVVMETDISVLARRIAQLERVMGIPEELTETSSDGATGTPRSRPASALAELRAAERRLSAIVPPELEAALRMMRNCRAAVSALDSDAVMRRARAAQASAVVEGAIVGLREMQVLQRSIDGAQYNLDEVVASAPRLDIVAAESRVLQRTVASESADVDALLERYNRSIAAANAAILRVAAAVRRLEAGGATAVTADGSP
eukprot:IDg19186t1